MITEDQNEELKCLAKHISNHLIKAYIEFKYGVMNLTRASNFIGMPRATLQKKCEQGKVKSHKVDGKRYIKYCDLMAYINPPCAD